MSILTAMVMDDRLDIFIIFLNLRYCYIVHVFGEGDVAFYAAPNPFLLNKICLNESLISRDNKSLRKLRTTEVGHHKF